MSRPPILIADDTPELLKLLTHILKEAGFTALPAGRGKEALRIAQAQVPALAILDLLLPDMTGYQLADALRRQIPKLPIIFITGVFKGPRQSYQARQKYGVTDYFEKPFDARALISAVRRLVPAPAIPEPERAPALIGTEATCEEDRHLEPMELSGVVRFSDGKPIFWSQAAPIVLQPPTPNDPAPHQGAPLASSETARSADGTERGELRDNLPQLINAFHQSQETGELLLLRGRIKKLIFFRHGRPTFARSNVISDRLGPFLVRIGKIGEGQLAEARQKCGGDESRLDQALVELGLLSAGERPYFMGQQVKSIIYSTFCWEDGAYELTFRKDAPAHPLELDFHPANLILRSVKRLYKPERLRRLLAPEERVIPSLQPTYALNEIDLEPWEAQLLPRADGTRTVAELMSMAAQPAAKVQAFLYAMVALTILERRA